MDKFAASSALGMMAPGISLLNNDMNELTMTDGLHAFRGVDFNWAAQLQDIWHDAAWDVPDLHADVRREFTSQIQSMQKGNRRSPLGWLLIGSAGVGKTHLLGNMRQEAARQRAGFVLVDMTDVRDFWDVVLQGYLDSLQTVYVDGKFQYQVLLFQFISKISGDAAARNLAVLARRKTTALSADVKRIVLLLRRKYPREALEYQDALRALICLNSDDPEIAATGYGWLQGQEVEDQVAKSLGFTRNRKRPHDIVRALSWFMSLSGPTVVAFDQLDPIIQQFRHQAHLATDDTSEEEATARTIVEQIGAGLGAMNDTTYNTLTVVSCVESSFELLRGLIFKAHLDRFEEPKTLRRPATMDVHRMLIRGRLAPAYEEAGFEPPYETWPFRPRAIEELTNESVREVLKFCEQHRKACVLAGKMTELSHFRQQPADAASDVPAPLPANRFQQLDDRFYKYRDEADPDELLEEKQEDERLAPLYRTALDCLVRENEQRFPDDVEPVVEHEFSGGKTTKPLHARLRVVDHRQDSREDHYCVRALQRRHHAAYQTRLKAAMTQSGIDKALKFRHLVIIRSFPVPGGAQTETLTRTFKEAGGRFHEPSDEELRTLAALTRLSDERDPQLADWLQQRRPVSRLGLGRALTSGSPYTAGSSLEPTDELPASIAPPIAKPDTKPDTKPTVTAKRPPGTADGSTTSPALVNDTRPATPAPPINSSGSPATPPVTLTAVERDEPAPTTARVGVPSTSLPVGRKMMGLGKFGEFVSLPLAGLTKHMIILGGSGSGKSVTVRRLVEEAALAGIPSIILDGAQDMCFFDTSWPEPPVGWSDEDPRRAERFRGRVEQVVWTPGSLSSGNPLSLRPLPDFTPVKDDPEELHDAVMMAGDGLRHIVAPGNSEKAKKCYGVLIHSLKYFATHFPREGLDGYIAFLSELPPGAALGIPNETKLAEEIAANLKVARTSNPLLSGDSLPLDPLILFGDDATRPTVRISVISLVKLKGQNAAQGFLNQLAMELFAWIKQNPTPPGNRALRGLLVLDEARDFVPSGKSTECKESMMRLAAQARKYRLGLVFATQHPKDIETKIVGNCATHLYGLNNSPASLDTLQDLMAQKGGSGSDIPKLKAGQFYIHNADAGHESPIKIQVPMSLTYSPTSPLEEAEILRKATESLQRVR